jgi:hypothetical protein
MRRAVVRLSLFVIALGFLSLVSAAAEACPMCNQTIANENALPRAYMYSILFMLGMPATVFTSFGVFLHHKFRTHNAAQMGLLQGDTLSPAEANTRHSVSAQRG